MIVTPPPCRIPSDPHFRYRSDLSQSVDKTLVLISVAIIDMSSVVHLRSSQSFLPNRVMLRLFPWRSPHTLFTYAAQGGLGSPPDRRTRGACPHHKYSMVELHPEDLPSGHTDNNLDTDRPCDSDTNGDPSIKQQSSYLTDCRSTMINDPLSCTV